MKFVMTKKKKSQFIAALDERIEQYTKIYDMEAKIDGECSLCPLYMEMRKGCPKCPASVDKFCGQFCSKRFQFFHELRAILKLLKDKKEELEE